MKTVSLAGDKIVCPPKLYGKLKFAAARIVESRTTARAAWALESPERVVDVRHKGRIFIRSQA